MQQIGRDPARGNQFRSACMSRVGEGKRKLWALKNRNGVGEYPSMVGKCWQRRGFFLAPKNKERTRSKGNLGNFRRREYSTKTLQFTR